jgi:hypothetical protein
MSEDPGLITASQLIRNAEERARQAENQAQFAEDRAKKAEEKRDELIKELAALSSNDARPESWETAQRLVSRIYDSLERANWDPYDEDEPAPKAHAMKDYLISWLADALDKAATK